MPTIRLLDLRYHVVRMRTRFPFHYGIAAMTSVPHVFFRGEFEIGGKPAVGFSSDGLPPKWFTKNPGTLFDEDLVDMLDVIEHAWLTAASKGTMATFFDWWRALYAGQDAWAGRQGIPPLLAHLGTSLIERAGIDALCRATGKPLGGIVGGNDLGIRLGDLHPELGDQWPGESIRQGMTGDPTLYIRHTVGLADPLADAEIPEAERVDDGLPQSLEACIRAYGLRYFKIKLCGDFDRDAGRLRKLAKLLASESPGFRFTLDGNEQFKSVAAFREQWDRHRADPALREFLSAPHLIFVEQPVHRDEALADHVGADLAEWADAPPLIIDESDGTLGAARQALDLGYAGTSHKNCKGVIKGLANACLLRQRSAVSPATPLIHSGEDLANVGPVALLQDLAVMRVLGIRHVERNGHHYFRGLSALGGAVNAAVLHSHGDHYAPLADGTAALAIRDGQISLGSVIDAPFGTAFRIDEVLAPWLTIDEWRERGVFSGY